MVLEKEYDRSIYARANTLHSCCIVWYIDIIPANIAFAFGVYMYLCYLEIYISCIYIYTYSLITCTHIYTQIVTKTTLHEWFSSQRGLVQVGSRNLKKKQTLDHCSQRRRPNRLLRSFSVRGFGATDHTIGAGRIQCCAGGTGCVAQDVSARGNEKHKTGIKWWVVRCE